MAHELTTLFAMITGPSSGAGKTTLAAGLCDALRRDGNAVKLVPEEWIFEWPEFAELARMFKERRYPSSVDLLKAFDELEQLIPEGALWLQDWSWIDLAEDLPWAIEDAAELQRFSRRLSEAARSLSPMVLYLSLDPLLGVQRAVHQRGERWFHKPTTDVVDDYAFREPRLLGAFEAGGWRMVRIDASQDKDGVLQEALNHLRV